MKTVFLFPGQGSQQVGMLNALPAADPIVKAVFDDAESFLQKTVLTLDTEAALTSTINVQLCLLIAGVISARQLIHKGIQPDFVAGHSIGAFAAAVTSGALSFKQAIKLVQLRATLMQDAFPIDYGMTALIGFSENRLKPYLVRHNANHSTVYLANINAADQLIIAGRVDSMEILTGVLKRDGIQKIKRLKMPVPSHCELLVSVSEALKQALEPMQLNQPAIPYASNSTGRLLKTVDAIKNDLWSSVSSTVKWYDATSLIYEYGARIFIEMQPAGVLTKIAESTFPDIKAIAFNGDDIDRVYQLWNDFNTSKI